MLGVKRSTCLNPGSGGGFSDDARVLLEHVWLEVWLSLPAAAGDLDKPFATERALTEPAEMSAATVDRYLKPARDRMRIKGVSTTKPSPLLAATRHVDLQALQPSINRLAKAK